MTKLDLKQLSSELDSIEEGLKELLTDAIKSHHNTYPTSLYGIFKELGDLHVLRADILQDAKLYIEAETFYQYAFKIYQDNEKKFDPNVYDELHDCIGNIYKKLISLFGHDPNIFGKDFQQDVSQYKEKLKILRKYSFDALNKMDKANNFAEAEKLLSYITEKLKDLLANVYSKCEKVLGTPPCEYAVMGLGSMALSQMTPYSDLEFAILIEDVKDKYNTLTEDALKDSLIKLTQLEEAKNWSLEELIKYHDKKNKDYFRNLTHLVNFYIIGLGESIVPTSKYNLDLSLFVPQGVSFDLGGKTPLGRIDKPYELIDTPEGMMRYLKNEERHSEHRDKALFSILETYVHVHGNYDLFENYDEKANQYLLGSNEVYKGRAIQRLKEGTAEYDYLGTGNPSKLQGHVDVFAPKLKQEDEGQFFNAKKEIYRPVDRFLYELAFFHKIQPTSIWNAVTELSKKNIIAKESCEKLLEATNFANIFRLSCYLFHGAQKELVSVLSKEISSQKLLNVFYLSNKHLEESDSPISLFSYYYTIIPLHKKLQDFCNLYDNCPDYKFQSEIFFDNSLETSAQIYKRLNQHEKAHKIYETILARPDCKIEIRKAATQNAFELHWYSVAADIGEKSLNLELDPLEKLFFYKYLAVSYKALKDEEKEKYYRQQVSKIKEELNDNSDASFITRLTGFSQETVQFTEGVSTTTTHSVNKETVQIKCFEISNNSPDKKSCTVSASGTGSNHLGDLLEEGRLVIAPGESANKPNMHIDNKLFNLRKRLGELVKQKTDIDICAINKARKAFIGEKEAKDLRQFNSWYDLDTIKYLIHLPDTLQGQCNSIKYVFYDENWDTQLEQLSVLKNSLDNRVLFISKEPGAGNNHFIFGVLIGSNLLIVNPVGITDHKDFYDKLAELSKSSMFSDIYISNTHIQCDPKGLVSCGPIVVELLKNFASLPDEEVVKVFSSGKKINKHEIEFNEINIEDILPKSLRNLLDNADTENYKDLMIAIRSNHLLDLSFVDSKMQYSIEEQNKILEDCLNTPAQIFVNKLAVEKKSILEIENTPEYNLFKSTLLSHTNKPYKNLPNQNQRLQGTLHNDKYTVDIGYWYTEDDVKDLLEKQLRDRATIIAQTQFDHASLMQDNVRQALKEAIDNNKPSVIPIHLNNNHWTGAVIKRLDSKKIQVIYNDPKGTKIDTQENIVNFIEAITAFCEEGFYNPDVIDLELKQQINDNDCGPFTVENLVSLATQDTSDKSKAELSNMLETPRDGSAARIREKHAELKPCLKITSMPAIFNVNSFVNDNNIEECDERLLQDIGIVKREILHVDDIKKLQEKANVIQDPSYLYQEQDIKDITQQLFAKKVDIIKIANLDSETIDGVLHEVTQYLIAKQKTQPQQEKLSKSQQQIAMIAFLQQKSNHWLSFTLILSGSELQVIYQNPSGDSLSIQVYDKLKAQCATTKTKLTILDIQTKQQTQALDSGPLILSNLQKIITFFYSIERVNSVNKEAVIAAFLNSAHKEHNTELLRLEHSEIFYGKLIKYLLSRKQYHILADTFLSLGNNYFQRGILTDNPELITESTKYYQYVISITNMHINLEDNDEETNELNFNYKTQAQEAISKVRIELISRIGGDIAQVKFQDIDYEIESDRAYIQALRTHSIFTIKQIDNDLEKLQKNSELIELSNLDDVQQIFSISDNKKECFDVKAACASVLQEESSLKNVIVNEHCRREWIEQQEADWRINCLRKFLDPTENIRNDIFVEKTRKLFEHIADQIRIFLKNLCQDAEKILGAPPCSYAVIGLGSMALQQITPYSDLEFAILTENEQYLKSNEPRSKNYFTSLSHLIHFRVINLGETVIPTSRYGIDLSKLTKVGINFDLGGKTPLGRLDKDKPYSLIKTPEKMARYQEEKYIHVDKALPYILETCISIYEYYDFESKQIEQNLVHDYKNRVRIFLENRTPAGITYYQARALKRLKEESIEYDYLGISEPGKLKSNLVAYEPHLSGQNHEGKLFDVKHEIYRLVDRLIYDLTFYYSPNVASVWDAVDQLSKLGVISDKTGAHGNLLYAVSIATMLRLRIYSTYHEQKDKVESRIIASMYQNDLFKYYYVVLPFYQKLVAFCDIDINQNHKNVFLKECFFKCDYVTKSHACLRLMLYDKTFFYMNMMLKKALLDRNLIDTANILLDIGKAYVSSGVNAQKSIEYLSRALSIKEQLYDSNHLEITSLKINLGNAYSAAKDTDQAVSLLKDALVQWSSNPPNELHFSQLLSIIGDTYVLCDNTVDALQAITYYKQSISITTRLFGLKSINVARTLIGLGAAYGIIGREKMKLSILFFVLETLDEHFGAQHFLRAKVLRNIGNAYKNLGDCKKQAVVLEKALKIFGDFYIENHEEVISALSSLVDSYIRTGNYSEAVATGELALKLLASTEAERSDLQILKTKATILTNLGNSYQASGKLDAAVDAFHNALEIKKQVYGNHHLSYARTLCDYASTVVDHKERIKLKEIALSIFEAKLGNNNVLVARTLSNIGESYIAIGKYLIALEKFKQALKILHVQQGIFSYDIIHIYILCGNAYGVFDIYHSLSFWIDALKGMDELKVYQHEEKVLQKICTMLEFLGFNTTLQDELLDKNKDLAIKIDVLQGILTSLVEAGCDIDSCDEMQEDNVLAGYEKSWTHGMPRSSLLMNAKLLEKTSSYTINFISKECALEKDLVLIDSDKGNDINVIYTGLQYSECDNTYSCCDNVLLGIASMLSSDQCYIVYDDTSLESSQHILLGIKKSPGIMKRLEAHGIFSGEYKYQEIGCFIVDAEDSTHFIKPDIASKISSNIEDLIDQQESILDTICILSKGFRDLVEYTNSWSNIITTYIDQFTSQLKSIMPKTEKEELLLIQAVNYLTDIQESYYRIQPMRPINNPNDPDDGDDYEGQFISPEHLGYTPLLMGNVTLQQNISQAFD